MRQSFLWLKGFMGSNIKGCFWHNICIRYCGYAQVYLIIYINVVGSGKRVC